MQTQKDQRPARLRLLVLAPIVTTFLLAIILVIFSIKTFFNYQLEEENKAATQRVKTSFNAQITHDITEISSLIQLIEQKTDIQFAWQKKDRQMLIKATEEVYQAIRTTFDITHFYFHSLNGVNFLRVHRPSRFGDDINRKTLSTSRRTGKLSAGLEVGTFGQLALRIVKPWIINGQLVGYLELGKEVNHISQKLKASTNADIITLINKKFIIKEEWEKSFGQKFDWRTLNKWAITASTFTTIPENLNLLFHEKNRPRTPSHHGGTRTHILSYFSLTDFSNVNVGRMLVIQDVSSSSKQLRHLLINITIFGSIVTLILSIAYFVYLGKIETQLSSTNRSLHKKIAEHEVAENKLRINRDELAATNRELESYSYSIAHDLRAPLRSVTSFSQIVLEDAKDKLNTDETDNLNRVIAASLRMADLIDDILQLSRITREELTYKNINLSKIIENNQRQLSSQDPDRVVEWDIQAHITVNADPRLLERAIENLISNAWKYTAYANNAKIIFGSLQRNNETVYFVRDNGAGFDMNYAHKLFATFQRLHNPREFTGSGVGLAIALRVIQRHHGRIWGEGAVGKGATFYFTLPDNPVSA